MFKIVGIIFGSIILLALVATVPAMITYVSVPGDLAIIPIVFLAIPVVLIGIFGVLDLLLRLQ